MTNTKNKTVRGRRLVNIAEINCGVSVKIAKEYLNSYQNKSCDLLNNGTGAREGNV